MFFIIVIVLPSFSPLVFSFWYFVPLVFVQSLQFYSFSGNNMYVPGDCNILLISVCDLQCYRKKRESSDSKYDNILNLRSFCFCTKI